MRLSRTAIIAVTASVCAVVVALPTGVGVAAYYHDHARLRVLPAHSVVGGVNVAGLDRTAAIARIRTIVDRQLDRRGTLLVGSASYSTTLRGLGVHDNAAEAVDAAFSASRHGSWLSRSWHRVFGSQRQHSEAVHLSRPSQARLQAIVNRAVTAAGVHAVDASVSLTGGFATFTAGKPGVAVNPAAALAAFRASLSDGVPRRVEPEVVQPKVSDSAYDTVIVVHINENRLYLYKNHKMVRTFPVATGQSRYPTPTGRFSVTLKRFMPTWYNPHDVWSVNEPPTIPPGPGNPLGVRAMNLSAPGIRIHGSPSDYSIGYNASHGCIRMHNSDVVQLYPLIPTGTTVFLTRVGPYKPLPVAATKKPPKKAPVINAEGG
jgi:lipoprotein-anchoring transpeptidase ErfK/SrfK